MLYFLSEITLFLQKRLLTHCFWAQKSERECESMHPMKTTKTNKREERVDEIIKELFAWECTYSIVWYITNVLCVEISMDSLRERAQLVSLNELVFQVRILKHEIGLGPLTPTDGGTELVSRYGVIEEDVRALLEFFVWDLRFVSSSEPGWIFLVEAPIRAFELASGEILLRRVLLVVKGEE